MKVDYKELLEKLVNDYKITIVDKPFVICFIGGPGYGKSFLSKLIKEKRIFQLYLMIEQEDF